MVRDQPLGLVFDELLQHPVGFANLVGDSTDVDVLSCFALPCLLPEELPCVNSRCLCGGFFAQRRRTRQDGLLDDSSLPNGLQQFTFGEISTKVWTT